MRISRKSLLAFIFALVALPLCAADQAKGLDQVVDRVISREREVDKSLQQYTPLVETYIQNLSLHEETGNVPSSDRYFLGKADLRKGVRLQLLRSKSDTKHNLFEGFKDWIMLQYEPDGFLQMIFLDTEHFDRQHYKFNYVRREFLGEVRCLVFDVIPLPKSGKGRFLGRIWVEDQNYTIVRFNGAYRGSNSTGIYLSFDSWRVNAGPGLWVPAAIYSEENNLSYGLGKRLRFKSQTRLWGYNLGQTQQQEQELSSIQVESAVPVHDQTETANGSSPIQAQRAWNQQAEENVIHRLDGTGLLAPPGDVDKVLETVVNNLEVTNDLDIQPEVHCRVLLTTTLESFTAGHTIVLSRGLIDVMPDEATLATMLAHELGHIVLGHQIDTQYAFFDRMRFDDKEAFQHFTFTRTPAEEAAASQKAMELLKHSPYNNSLRNAALFGLTLDARAKQIPNLVSPHLGNRVPVSYERQNASAPPPSKRAGQISPLPLGSRVKLDPWSDRIQMLKTKAAGSLSEREQKMPFELTPFMLYLTRQTGASTTPAEKFASAKRRNNKP